MLKEFRKSLVENRKDALRLALQSASAALVTYIVISYLRPGQAFLAILSAVLIIGFNVGGTMHAAKNRTLATLLGCVLGILSVWLMPHGWGTSVAIVITMFILNAIAAVKQEWRYGVVAAISIALGSDENALEISIDRLIAIGTGALIGVVAALVIMPEKAEDRARRYMKNAIRKIGERFSIVIENTRAEEVKSTKESQKQIQNNLNNARETAGQIQFYDSKVLWKCIDALERIYNSVVMLDRVATESNTEIGGKESGIKDDADKFLDIMAEMLKNIRNGAFAKNSQLFHRMDDLIDSIRSDMKYTDANNKLLNMQHTFIFAIDETRKYLKILNDNFGDA